MIFINKDKELEILNDLNIKENQKLTKEQEQTCIDLLNIAEVKIKNNQNIVDLVRSYSLIVKIKKSININEELILKEEINKKLKLFENVSMSRYDVLNDISLSINFPVVFLHKETKQSIKLIGLELNKQLKFLKQINVKKMMILENNNKEEDILLRYQFVFNYSEDKYIKSVTNILYTYFNQFFEEIKNNKNFVIDADIQKYNIKMLSSKIREDLLLLQLDEIKNISENKIISVKKKL